MRPLMKRKPPTPSHTDAKPGSLDLGDVLTNAPREAIFLKKHLTGVSRGILMVL